MGVKSRTVKFYSTVSDRSEVVHLISRLFNADGGPGSGNHGHAGRPGKRGGSAPGKGAGTGTNSDITEQMSKAFKGISKMASRSKDYESFIKSLDDAQKGELQKQFEASGTRESLEQYTESLRMMLKAEPPAEYPKNKIVEGKNIIDSFNWDGKPYTESKFGQVIDTEIEAAMDKQGFLGLPKVVTQEEFNKIVSEHPEMPILFRSYAADNSDQLQDYDDMLEGGQWYVDCSIGGAQYGFGMYTSAVYPETPMTWDDPDLFENPRMKQSITDKNGNVFTTGQGVSELDWWLEEHTDDGEYLLCHGTDEDGNERTALLQKSKLDGFGEQWFDVNKGDFLDGDPVDYFQEAYRVEPGDKHSGNPEDMHAAMREMSHYRGAGISRCRESKQRELAAGAHSIDTGYSGEIPEKFFEHDGDGTRLYKVDRDGAQKIIDGKLPEGIKDGSYIFSFMPPYYKDKSARDIRSIEIKDGEIRSTMRIIPSKVQNIINSEDVKDKILYPLEIIGEENGINYDAVAATRIMTLDPSAKIVTYDEIRALCGKSDSMRSGAKWKRAARESEYIKDKDPRMLSLFAHLDGDKISEANAVEVLKYKQEKPEEFDAAIEFHKEIQKEYDQQCEDAKKYDKYAEKDPGVVATMLGYDAINAQGHGESGSYTVVLNRTKLIISEQRVDAA